MSNGLPIPAAMRGKDKRVVVAMSGGVDSSVAAALLVEQGYEVIGIMLHLWSEPGPGVDNRCCTPQAVEDARRVARALGIPFRVLNSARRFKEQVVEYFVREYACGHTPNPCLACNRHIKFGYLLDIARSLDAHYLATGHYARVRRVDGQCQLLRGCDRTKDQSYVLYMLGQEQLRHVLFPLGTYTKPQVRALAARLNLPVADKEESQDICFVRDQDYRRFLRDHASHAVRPGPILDTTGQVIGQHQGLPLYTIGQRRGLGIAALPGTAQPEPLYVLAIEAARNALIVGPASQLGGRSLQVKNVSFVAGLPPRFPAKVTTQIRYTGEEVAATLTSWSGCAKAAAPTNTGTLQVSLEESLRDITPGQGAVFYQDEVVLGGGIIADKARALA
jgi:tRNA-specific 2-thiouridylase